MADNNQVVCDLFAVNMAGNCPFTLKTIFVLPSPSIRLGIEDAKLVK